MKGISKIRVHIMEKDSLRAIVSILFAETFYMTGIRVINGSKGMFVSMPSREINKGGAKEYQDIYFPASKDVRDELSKAILEAYYDALDKKDEGVTNEG